MLFHSFLIESSSKLLVTRTGIKVRTSSISGLWFPWPIYMFFEMRGCQVRLVDDQKICFFQYLMQKRLLIYNGENSVSGLFTFEWFALIAEKTTLILTLAHWTQVSDHCPFGYLFLIRSFLYLQVTRTCIKSRTSSNSARSDHWLRSKLPLSVKTFPEDL